MHITVRMIRKELRFAGALVRIVNPSFSETKFRLSNRFLNLFRKGRCDSGLRFSEEYIPRPDGSMLRICVYRSKDRADNVPGLLWLHGGGFAMGVPEQDEAYIGRFIEAGNCVVVSPDYRRSLDAPYPAALEDSYTALHWMKEHAAEYGIRPDQLFVGGQSAGGGLAAALTLYARSKGEVAIAFQILLYPMLDDRMSTESAKDNDAPVWNSKSNRIAWKLYLGELFGADEIPSFAAPSRCEDYRGLPPAVAFVGELEPFRDEVTAYARNLEACGVPVRFLLCEGCFHGFDLFGKRTSIVQDALAFLMDAYRNAVKNYFAKQQEASTPKQR